MFCPTLRSEQNGASALDEEHTQIAISALRDAAKDRAITGRHLFRHQAKPRGKVSPFCKGSSIADRRDRGAGNDRADARNSHQLSTVHVGACQSLDLVCYPLDAIVEIFPVIDDVSDYPEYPGRQHVGARGPRVVATVAAGTEVLAARECRVPEESH